MHISTDFPCTSLGVIGFSIDVVWFGIVEWIWDSISIDIVCFGIGLMGLDVGVELISE